jgi:ZIP family zinc transporter
MLLENLVFVFVAGFVTALATGLGAIPFFLVDDISDRWTVTLWGLASGIMVSASLFGLIREGLNYGDEWLIVPGLLTGVLIVILGHRVVDHTDIDPRQYEQADFSKLVLILGVLTVHSFPEGVAVGVAFAELGLETGDAISILGFSAPVLGIFMTIAISIHNIPEGVAISILGFSAPVLAVFMTIAISIHNIPEGVAISIPLDAMGVSNPRKVWWAVFSSLPQPIGAAIAFAFVTLATAFLPFGFGFAAGAMIYLVATEFIPEAREAGAHLPGDGRRELATGLAVGVVVMVPLAFV